MCGFGDCKRLHLDAGIILPPLKVVHLDGPQAGMQVAAGNNAGYVKGVRQAVVSRSCHELTVVKLQPVGTESLLGFSHEILSKAVAQRNRTTCWHDALSPL